MNSNCKPKIVANLWDVHELLTSTISFELNIFEYLYINFF